MLNVIIDMDENLLKLKDVAGAIADENALCSNARTKELASKWEKEPL